MVRASALKLEELVDRVVVTIGDFDGIPAGTRGKVNRVVRAIAYDAFGSPINGIVVWWAIPGAPFDYGPTSGPYIVPGKTETVFRRGPQVDNTELLEILP